MNNDGHTIAELDGSEAASAVLKCGECGGAMTAAEYAQDGLKADYLTREESAS